jgi:hypothetical protein
MMVGRPKWATRSSVDRSGALAAVVGVAAQLLGGDLPEDAAPAEGRARAGELPVRAQDERRRAGVDLAVVHVVGELVEDDVALLAARRLRGDREDARDAAARADGLEGELGLRVDHQLLLVGERHLLVDLPREEDLLLGVIEVVADEHRRVAVAQVAARERLEGDDEGVADLAALGDPPEARAVLEERHLVGLEHDGLAVVGAEPRDEAGLRRQPVAEFLRRPLHEGQHGAPPPARRPLCRRFDLIGARSGACMAATARSRAHQEEPTP